MSDLKEEMKEEDLNLAMKRGYQNLLNKLVKGGINLKESPVVFKWTYEEDPFIQYQLMIIEKDQGELELEERDDDEQSIH